MSSIVPFDFTWFIYDTCMDAILLTTPDGRIHCANPAACKMFQMTEEELCRAAWSSIVDTGDPRHQSYLKERSENKKARAFLTFKRKGGQPFPAVCSSVLFHDYNGNLWTCMTIHDVKVMMNNEADRLRIQQVIEDLCAEGA